MKHFLYIAAFALAISLFYTAVGHVLPQLESRPPKDVALSSTSLTPDELIEAGAGVFDANCVQCHKIGRTDRCPDMGGMGQRAKDRAAERAAATGKPYDDLDYLLESMCKPGDHLVEGYANIMPPQGKLLNPGQMMAAAAFIQDQGGTVTATTQSDKALERLNRFGCVTGAAGSSPESTAVAAREAVGGPEQIWTTFGCGGCHLLDKPDRLLGPSLAGVGSRLERWQIFEAVLTPDQTMSEGTPPYQPGLMKATLEGNGFYERMTPADYKALVDWLAGNRG